MNYKSIHDRIIDRARGRILEGYSEKHHIIPKCMGGADDDENLINLTAKEHLIVHLLLCKIYPNVHGLGWAAWFMQYGSSKNKRVTGKEYDWIKKHMRHSDESKQKMSESAIAKFQNGYSHPMLGREHTEESKEKIRLANTGYKHSKEAREKMSRASTGRPGWNKGIPNTDEQKSKISAALKGRKLSPEHIQASAEGHRGLKRSNETRKNISKALTGRKLSPEHKANIRKAMLTRAKKKAPPIAR